MCIQATLKLVKFKMQLSINLKIKTSVAGAIIVTKKGNTFPKSKVQHLKVSKCWGYIW